jgi:hypothetical protein
MAVRDTMTDLIQEVRDRLGTTAQLTDAQTGVLVATDERIQQALDNARRYIFRNDEASALRRCDDDRHEWMALFRFWESGATFKDESGAALTPDASNLREGIWDFTTAAPTSVYVTGYCYNIPLAVVHVVDMILADSATTTYSYSNEAGSQNLSEIIRNLETVRRNAGRAISAF